MDFQKILEYRNERNLFCRQLGINLTELAPGYAKAVKTVTEQDVNHARRKARQDTALPRSLYRFRGSALT